MSGPAPRKGFGKRGARPPPFKTHAPPRPLLGLRLTLEQRQRMLAAIALGGAAALGLSALLSPRACKPEDAGAPRAAGVEQPGDDACASSGGHGSRSSSSSSSHGSSSSRGWSFGGFGGSGAAHGAGA